MTIGFFGGSFNPVHFGHIQLAQHIAEQCGLDRVWLSPSPQNPLKSQLQGATDEQRLEMLTLACRPYPNLHASAVELSLPKPSYTINTLRHLQQRCPQHRFRLIIGSDNWLIFDRWRSHEEILRDFDVIVYPRPGFDVAETPGATLLRQASLFPYSSTQVREALAQNADVSKMVPGAVAEYIRQNNLYQISRLNS